MKRWFKTLVHGLVAGQVLLSAPVVNAMNPVSHPSGGMEMPCTDPVPTADRDSCPCCEDGTSSMAACLSACTAMAAVVSSLRIPAVMKSATFLFDDALVHLAHASDPPLKPPPIV